MDIEINENKTEEVTEEVIEEKDESIKESKTEEVTEDLKENSKADLNKIITNTNCQNYIIEQNNIYCWDGAKFNLYKN